jgi:Uma2 family endonuclease
MDTNEHELIVLTHHPAATLRPLTVADYHRMGEAGIFAENERVELIEGQLIAMSPIGSPHVAAVIALTRLLVLAVEGQGYVSVQSSVRLDDRNEPEPDLVVLRPREDNYRLALPGPTDTLLVVEVAASSIDYDQGVKLALYARHGIREFWIVNLELTRVEVYRGPRETGSYEHCLYIQPDGSAEITELPGVSIPMTTIFG